jgi:hypothetical protein
VQIFRCSYAFSRSTSPHNNLELQVLDLRFATFDASNLRDNLQRHAWPRLTAVDVSHTETGDSVIEALYSRPIQHLALAYTHVTLKALPHLQLITSIRTLNLHGTLLSSPRGMSWDFSSMTSLEALDVGDSTLCWTVHMIQQVSNGSPLFPESLIFLNISGLESWFNGSLTGMHTGVSLAS